MDNENTELRAQVQMMKREIDALQVNILRASKPWYTDIATWLSIVAMIFSFGTTYVSYRRTASQDIENMRNELRGLLQRMAALPKENVEITKKYQSDPMSMSLIGSYINQENTLLSRNAAAIAKKLPKSSISAAEYYAIGVALFGAYDLAGANEFLELASKANPDFNVKIAVLRMLANMRFIQGAAEGGRDVYRKALDIFSEFPEYDRFTKASTTVITHLSWASSEASFNQLALAREHVDRATEALEGLPKGPGFMMLQSQINQAKTMLEAGMIALPPPVGPASISTMPAAKPEP
jgi:tetratricopeptide (TPR) repeat protein